MPHAKSRAPGWAWETDQVDLLNFADGDAGMNGWAATTTGEVEQILKETNLAQCR